MGVCLLDVQLFTVHLVGHTSARHKTLNCWLFMCIGMHLLDIRLWTIYCYVDGHASAGHTTLNYWLFMWMGMHLLDIRLWTIDCSCGWACICWTYDFELLTVHVDGHASAGYTTLNFLLFMWMGMHLLDIRRWTIDCSCGRACICWTYDVELFTVHVDGHASSGHMTLNYLLFMWMGMHLLDIRLWTIYCSCGRACICWTYDVELFTVHVDGHASSGHTTLNYLLFMWMGMHLLDIRRWTIYCSCGWACICWTYDVDFFTVHVDGHASAGHTTLNYLLFMWMGIHLLDIRRWTIDCSCGRACISWTYDGELLTVHVDGHASARHTTLNYWLFMWTGIHLLDIRRWTIDCSCGWACIC